MNTAMDDNTGLEVHVYNQMIKCLAGILLNHDLYINGMINKLLIDMNEEEYKLYQRFLASL